jgi:hypothetical protein
VSAMSKTSKFPPEQPGPIRLQPGQELRITVDGELFYAVGGEEPQIVTITIESELVNDREPTDT